MHFNVRNANGRQRISYRNTGMRVSGRVDDDVLRALTGGFLNSVDQGALMVALEDGQYRSLGPCQVFESFVDVGQRKPAVDLGLARAEQV